MAHGRRMADISMYGNCTWAYKDEGRAKRRAEKKAAEAEEEGIQADRRAVVRAERRAERFERLCMDITGWRV